MMAKCERCGLTPPGDMAKHLSKESTTTGPKWLCPTCIEEAQAAGEVFSELHVRKLFIRGEEDDDMEVARYLMAFPRSVVLRSAIFVIESEGLDAVGGIALEMERLEKGEGGEDAV